MAYSMKGSPFPMKDLSGDGKITKKDVLIGRGVIKKDESPAKKKDACYTKVKSRYKKWPSAYASGALVKCRKVGAANWGKSSPSKKTKNPRFTDRLYEKAAQLQSKADKAASEGKNKKAARLENRVARVEKREKKRRAKYNY